MDREHDRAVEIDLAEQLTDRRDELLAEAGIHRRHRIGLGWSRHSQTAVAKEIGINRVRLCQFEMGTHYPLTLGQWQRWARALGMALTVELRR